MHTFRLNQRNNSIRFSIQIFCCCFSVEFKRTIKNEIHKFQYTTASIITLHRKSLLAFIRLAMEYLWTITDTYHPENRCSDFEASTKVALINFHQYKLLLATESPHRSLCVTCFHSIHFESNKFLKNLYNEVNH